METLCDYLIAAGETIEVGGKTYKASVLTATDHLEIERYMVSKRPDPIAMAKSLVIGQPPEVARPILEKAYDDAQRRMVVTADEKDAFEETFEGQTYHNWLSLRRNHPDLTLGDAAAIIQLKTEDYFRVMLDAMRERVPDVTWEALMRVAKEHEHGWLQELTYRLDGMPRGNSSPPGEPAETTTEADPSTGLPSSG